MFWLDSYERRARLVPGMLLIAPVAIVVVMFGLRSNPVIATGLGALTAFGAPVVLANYVRHRGLEAQEDLYDEWGGKPTTTLLQSGASATGKRWRRAAEQVSGAQFPDPGQPDPTETYDDAVRALISQTRDRKRFGMVFNENRNYGYERNLYGLRRDGRTVAGLCLVGAGATVGVLVWVSGRSMRPEWIAGLVVLAVLLGVWIALPSKTRTRVTATKYAEQLLDAGVALAGPDSPEGV